MRTRLTLLTAMLTLLAAPSLEFHSTTETMIDGLVPHIDFTRIGLAANWHSELRVMFRLRGSERP